MEQRADRIGGSVLSAELLRKCASLMRQRANKATADVCPSWIAASVRHIARNCDIDCKHLDCEHVEDEAPMWCRYGDSEHIASWHPAVALAVADWLDSVAGANTSPDEDVPHAGRTIANVDNAAALAVARAYLGES